MLQLVMLLTLRFGMALLFVFAAMYRVGVSLSADISPHWQLPFSHTFSIAAASLWCANLIWAEWDWYSGNLKWWLLYFWSVALLPAAHLHRALALLAFALQLAVMHWHSNSCVSVALPAIKRVPALEDKKVVPDQK